MGVSIAYAVMFLAIAGAIASWIVGAIYFVKTLASIGRDSGSTRLLAIVAWPFAVGRLKGAAADYATIVNKALVAFMACIMTVIAATAVATNLARLAK